MASQQDEHTLQRMKESWEKKLTNETIYIESILPLLNNASKVNSKLFISIFKVNL